MLACVLLLIPFLAAAAEARSIKVRGVASPQSESEQDNVEVLRARALRNAIDTAVERTQGIRISTERSDQVRYSNSKQQSEFRREAISETSGYARVEKVVKEGFHGDSYEMEVVVKVLGDQATHERSDLGFFWKRAGKPKVSFAYEAPDSGAPLSTYTERYLRENLVANGLELSEQSEDYTFRVHVVEKFETQMVSELGTFKSYCYLALEIVDWQGTERFQNTARNGPTAGFSEEASQTRCMKAIAEPTTGTMINALAGLFDELWRTGNGIVLMIEAVPGRWVSSVVEGFQQMFHVSEVVIHEYTNERLVLFAKYRGGPQELLAHISESAGLEPYVLVPRGIAPRELSFRWRGLGEP